MKRSTRPGFMLITVSAIVMNAPITVRADAKEAGAGREQNLALGAAYVVSSAPNYQACKDAGDATQLTDGQLTDGHFWTQKGTVGWYAVSYVTITIDLGRLEPIAGVSLRTAAGAADVLWPAALRIQVSDDGKSYGDVGDLLDLDENARDLPKTYAVRRLTTSKLKTRGRYVRLLVIPTGTYFFADEIEVFRGDAAFLQFKTDVEPAGTGEEHALRYRMQAGIRRRFEQDKAGLERAIRAATLNDQARKSLIDRLVSTQKGLGKTIQPGAIASFRAILPLNEAHADLFRVQAALWKTMGHPALCAWTASQWKALDLFEAPAPSSSGAMAVHLMQGEYRSSAFNLANTTDVPMRVSIRFAGLPGSPTPPFVTLHQVPWTDTVTGQAVAAALVEVAPGDGSWTLDLPPGLVQQIWLTCQVTDLAAGEYPGRVVVTSKGVDEVTIPMNLHVYPLTFPAKTTLWLGGWSYTDGAGTYGVNPQNHKLFVEHLQSHFVNAPWATSQVMMQFAFKDGPPPTIELDSKRLDDWLAEWPEARAYLVFVSVGESFAGTQMGTEAFQQKVGIWISAWVHHLASRGVEASRLGLLLVDEPMAHRQDDIIIAWAEAIRAAEPKVLIWEDPIYHNPKEGRPEMFELCDILCPSRPMWLSGGKEFGQFYLDQQKRGRTLQLYSCSGPARLLDPYAYYRLQAWHCWRIGATGSFFWAFGDNNGVSSWNEYAAVSGPFTPLFLDERSVTAGKQMEAIRESIEDYEYLFMLRKAVAQALSAGKGGASLARAQALLERAASEVLDAPGASDLAWHSPKDSTKADAVRIQILEALSGLAPAQ